MIVRDATDIDLREIATAMREADRREIFAHRWSDEIEDFLQDFAAARPAFLAVKALCAAEFDPIAIVGAFRRAPTIASVVMFATDRFPEIALPATRWVRRTGLPAYVDPWCRRAQCEAWVENVASLAWLQTLGFRREGVLRAYGKNGEDYVQYARLRPALASPPDVVA